MYPVTVLSNNEFTKRQVKALRKFGLEWDGLDFCGYIPQKKTLLKVKYYCQQHHLKFKINNSLGNRSTDYRRIFLKTNKPQFMGKFYICAYCGRLMKESRMTVDHLYPIGRSSKSVKYQEMLESKGIKNINDPKNLVPACRVCNQRKSAKTGIWIIRGHLGRNKYIWYIRWFIRIVIFSALMYLLFVRFHIQDDFIPYIKELSRLFLR